MAKDYRKMIVAVCEATKTPVHKISKSIGRQPNCLGRYLNDPARKLSIESGQAIEDLHNKHCSVKPINPFAAMVTQVKAKSSLTDLQLATVLGVSVAWISRCTTTAHFDPRVSEARRLQAIFNEWESLNFSNVPAGTKILSKVD